MDDSLGGGFPSHIQNRFGSSVPLQAPHLERRGDYQWENRPPTRQPRGRDHGTHPITPHATVVNQGQSLGPSFPPAPYTNPVNNTGGFFHDTPQGLSNASPPRHPPGNYHHHHPYTQSSPLINGHHAFNPGGSNMEAPQAFPPDVTQATHQGIRGSMAEVGSTIQRPGRALSPQAGSSNFFSSQRRAQSLPCLVPGCPSSFSRAQDQRRHLLTHLPHWIHCPAPECDWRGDRPNAFIRHWGNHGHPSGIQVPNEDQCRTYDPQPLMRAISEGTLDIQAAQRHAVSMVRRRALELLKPELSDNPWGSKCKRLKNSDLRQMIPTN